MANINGTPGNDIIPGTEQDDTISGLAGDDTLSGLGGNDTLDGGEGSDTLIGGLGDDIYVLNDLDTITENAGEGTDTVRSSMLTYTLGANLENLVLTGSGNISGFGNDLNNTITGNSGNNFFNGGVGADIIAGLLGNDTYVVGASDIFIENPGGGNDTARSGLASYTLAANIENLVLTGTANINGTGNAIDNAITGNAGDNILSGGAGIDTLAGGLGNDTYLLDIDDSIAEAAASGIDTVRIRGEYILSDINLENLILDGTGAFNGYGNSANNRLTGNGGANILSGLDGNDTLIGGTGTDRLIGGNGDDMLDGGNHIDTMNGGEGNDLLSGGLGNDTLAGGTGSDIFRFDTAPNNTNNHDRVLDFLAVDDTIQLDDAVFTQLTAPGVLNANNFRASINGNAADADDYILYETDTGVLSYDADGSGAGAKVWIASLTSLPVITNADFEVI